MNDVKNYRWVTIDGERFRDTEEGWRGVYKTNPEAVLKFLMRDCNARIKAGEVNFKEAATVCAEVINKIAGTPTSAVMAPTPDGFIAIIMIASGSSYANMKKVVAGVGLDPNGVVRIGNGND